MVGGTGLYVDSLLYGFSFNGEPDSRLRDELNNLTLPELQAKIKAMGIDIPKSYSNPRHLIRAIETQGKHSSKGSIMNGAIVIGIDPGREMLKIRIEDRAKKMLNDGFVDEVKKLVQEYGRPPENWDAIGYKIVLESIEASEVGLDSALVDKLAAAHRQYAKRQRAWFKRSSDIAWFDSQQAAVEHILKQL